MPTKVRRYQRGKSGIKKKMSLEKKELGFLKGIPFYAIAEHKKGKRTEILIEFEPKSIEKFVSKVKKAKKLRLEGNKLIETVKNLKQKNDALQAKVVQNEAVIKLLQREIEKKENKMNPREKSPLSYHSIMDKKGLPLRGLPMQGGLPSLGKS